MAPHERANHEAMTEATERRPIRRALLSVYDKTGLDDLIRALGRAGVQIVSTGKTAGLVESLGVPVTRVEELTGFPECLDGRVKTLHPKVHAGLLADLRQERHRDQLDELGIEPFDLLVSNLYPFSETVASGADVDGCIEQIDIGGPAMVRAGAKNHATVAVVTSPAAYPLVLRALDEGGTTLAERRELAARAFADIAAYDVAVAQWCAQELAPAEDRWPEFAGTALTKAAVLRYGENPHQRAALYLDSDVPPGLAQARQLGGKEMSYNNYVDADAAWRACHDFSEPAVAIIKHANPCGIAIGVDGADAHRKAHACDPVSAFGGVIASNRPVSVEMAAQIAEIFTEVVVAPSYEDGAVEALTRKKNLRVLVAPDWQPSAMDFRQVSGGVLVQSADRIDADGDDPAKWQLAAGEPVSPEMLDRPAVRVAGRPFREVQRDSARRGRRHGGRRHGSGQPRRFGAARGVAGRRASARFGGRVGRVLPVRRWTPGPDRRGRAGRRGAGRLGPG